MQIKRIDFISVIPDNEESYFSLLEGTINSVDELSNVEIRRNPNNYKVRVATSSPKYLNPLIDSINDLHKMLCIRLDYSKSIKSSCAITFYLDII